jgi:hypothetical protein
MRDNDNATLDYGSGGTAGSAIWYCAQLCPHLNGPPQAAQVYDVLLVREESAEASVHRQ